VSLMSKNRTREDDGAPNPTDVHVGQQLRQRRTQMQMSQERLAESLGLTFQQIQKYERGQNRIGASRLLELGRVLEVPVSYFFNPLESLTAGLAEDVANYNALPVLDPETAELLRLFKGIEDIKQRRQILQILKTFAETSHST
jgi:transcriptional regulator with XRE-family HTH domain